MNLARRLGGSLLILITLVLADILTIYHVDFLGVGAIVWGILAIPVLGSLILSLFFDVESFDFQEWIIYCVGVGLAALMLIGLIVNAVGLQLNHPIFTRSVMLPIVNIIILGLLLIRTRLLLMAPSAKRLFPKFLSEKSLLHVARTFLPLCLPLLVIAGAIRLNNGAGDSIALVALVLICAYPLALIAFAKKLHSQEITIGFFAIALALALSVSMRSNYLIGFDIHQEFEVFSATARTGLWHPHLFNDAYNACLSITVLPATLKALMPISSEYLFKFIMQLIFGIMPLIVFVIANRRLNNKKYAYIATIFFIVQGPFIFEFPGLIRQQIGLIFFGLIFASVMSNRLSKIAKDVLLIIFGIAMVTSHYSTTYVAVALLLLLVSLRPFFLWARDNLFKKSPYSSRQLQEVSWYISPILVLVIMLTAFMWYGETLQATGGVVQKVTSSITNFSSIFNSDSHSDFVTSTFGLGGYTYNSQTLQKMAASNSVNGGYRPSLNQYEPQPASPNAASINNNIENSVFNIEHKIIPLFAGAMVAVGLLSMFLAGLFNRGGLEEGVLATCAGCLFLLLALLPSISQDYNLERLYQQLLVVISPAFIYGFFVIFKRWLKPGILIMLMMVTAICYLLGTTGLVDQFVFGISNINLVNDGVNYDHYYTTKGDVQSLVWVQGVPELVKVNLDRYSILNAKAYTTIPSSKLREGVFPSEVTSKSFVYASLINNKGLAFDLYQSHTITYNFPAQYLSDNKNTVYSNQDSVIYR